MILLNFTHPLRPDQLAQVETITGQPVLRVIDAPAQLDPGQPFAPQVAALADACDLTSAEWQTVPLLVVPPALNFIAALLLAELHGRTGYFVPVLRLRPVPGAVPPRYEAAEVLDLQGQRDAARLKRRT
ncbi:MAG: hypothetical protein KKA73_07140 [Chloroflexi bacterium]|nr:hypothetical protein [Chloroflexota bacterium]MBU1747445.1 hypothetical protein [Chloroflexota bacterium]